MSIIQFSFEVSYILFEGARDVPQIGGTARLGKRVPDDGAWRFVFRVPDIRLHSVPFYRCREV